MSNRATYLSLALSGAVLLYLASRTKHGAHIAEDYIADTLNLARNAPQLFGDLLAELGEGARNVGSVIVSAGSWLSKVPERFKSTFASAAARYGLPTNLLERIAYQESRFREDVISGQTTSSAGAVGIMQIVPKWHPDVDPRDPEASIEYAASYLRKLFLQFGDWKLALAAYNWGPGNQQKDLMDNIIGNEWPKETRDYVAQISADVGLA